MTVIDIDETTETGRDILRRLAKNPEAGKVREFKIPRDENGVPIGYTVDEVFDEAERDLSELYGVDFAKVSRMLKSGRLNKDELTNEMLLSATFKYEPYTGFKPKQLPSNFNLNPAYLHLFDSDR
jgi:hypothetical protein